MAFQIATLTLQSPCEINEDLTFWVSMTV
uniref:Uncharacterized protein n=1 Tax=Arundo donax TaxID=35708 RepID=A0A0A9B7K0_ARUDO